MTLSETPDVAGPQSLVVIPTYDEIDSLPGVLDRLRAVLPEVSILVVDDSSPDGTGQWAEDRSRADTGLSVLHRPGKSGLAGAYVEGFRWGIDRGSSAVVEMDADGSHRPEQLPKLLARLGAFDRPDLVIGSRWVAGGHVNGWSKAREALSRAGNLYIRAMLGMDVTDATAGFRVYRTTWLKASGVLDMVGSAGYGFQVEMTLAANRAGAAIVEVPITFDERRFGTSKLTGDIFVEELRLVTRQGLERMVAGQ